MIEGINLLISILLDALCLYIIQMHYLNQEPNIYMRILV